MKCNPWRWLWGLIPILMLGWIAVLGERGRIEADLTARTLTVLERSGFGWANVSFEGRDAVLSGRAVEEADPAKAAAAALDTMGVRVVNNQASLIDVAERYEWSAIRRDHRIRVDGLVPSDKTRREVIGMVKANFPSLDVDDRMKLARGAPPLDVWMGGVNFGLKQLALLSEGRVDLEQTSLSVRGDALDARGYRSIKAALAGQVPQGIRLKSEAVRPPVASPYVWSARRQGKEILLVGHVPSDAVRDDIMRHARKLAPETRLVDRMEPASGAPESFAAAAAALLEQLSRLEEGSGQIRDRSASLSGLAETAVRAGEVAGLLRQGILASFRTTGDIRHREPEIKTISPYETVASFEAGSLALTGYVPDEKARAGLLAVARQRFSGRAVRDELQLGAGQPPGWEECLEVGLEALRRLSAGRVALNGRRLHVSGTTDAEPLAQSLPAEVRARVGTACDADVRVTLDLASIQAEAARQQAEVDRRRAEAAARQQAEADRRRVEEAARQQAEADRRRVEAAARQQAEADRRRVEEAARQQAEADRRRVEEAARQQAEADRRRVEEAARQQAEAAASAQSAQRQAAEACQQALSRVVREGVINFKRASFDLEPASYTTLNRVAEAANRCPTLVVEIEGHTDSEGTPERNRRLADRRANSVRDYLARAGVDSGRLTAVGYGQDRNIAPNDTAEGRARNRRIEFTVKTMP